MSDDIISKVKSLIDSKKGDAERLHRILEELTQGKPIDITDENYLQELENEPNQNNSELQNGVETESFGMSEHEEENSSPQDFGQWNRNPPSRRKNAIIVSVIAAIVIAYVGLDVYSVSMLEFRPHYGSQYQISPTEIHIQADVCNPSYFPATFNKYEISAYYNSDLVEQAQIQGNMISPKTAYTLDGVFVLNLDTVLKLKQENATFNPSLATITTTVDAPIFGAIPFSVVKNYTAEQFQEVLKNGPPGSFSCH